MIHLLKTEKNILIISCEVIDNKFEVSLDINEYSKILLWIHSEDKSKTQDFINDFSNFGSSKAYFESQESASDFLKTKLTEIATKWGFSYCLD
jgi:hypothetical protein